MVKACISGILNINPCELNPLRVEPAPVRDTRVRHALPSYAVQLSRTGMLTLGALPEA